MIANNQGGGVASMAEKPLSARKRRILTLLVAQYIATAQPVSSADIKKAIEEDISPATIRAELSTLEDMGYLVQPHISAGRIPSGKAYRLYVETLPALASNKNSAIADIKSYFDNKMGEIEDVVRSTAHIISDVTNYTSVIVVKNISDIIVKNIKLIDLGEGSALVVIVTDSGVIKDNFIDLPVDMGSGYIDAACTMLNKLFAGKTLDEIKAKRDDLDDALTEYKSILNDIIKVLEKYSNGDPSVYVDGTAKLLEHPEYAETENAKKVLDVIDHKKELSAMMTSGDDIEFTVRIGKDEDGIDNCSIVSAKYVIGTGKEVHAGVIGPERMNYEKVIEVLKHLDKVFKETDKNKKED